MKKLVVFAAVIFMSTAASAQFRLKAGMNLSTLLPGSELKAEMEAYEDEYGESYYGSAFKMTPGIKLMGTYEFGIKDFFSLETGLGVTSKGTSQVYSYEDTYSGGSESYVSKSRLHLLYGQVPLMAKFSFPIGETRMSIGAGGYFGAGITGMARSKYKYTSTSNGDTYSETEGSREIAGFEEMGVKHLDYGLSSSIGIEYKRFLLEATYEFGIANVVGGMGDYFTYRNSTFGLSLGYKFGKKT